MKFIGSLKMNLRGFGKSHPWFLGHAPHTINVALFYSRGHYLAGVVDYFDTPKIGTACIFSDHIRRNMVSL